MSKYIYSIRAATMFLCAAILLITYMIYQNGQITAKIDLGFFGQPANFDISWSMLQFQPTDTYLKVFFIGVLNTLFLAFFGILVGSALGILIGIARRSEIFSLRVASSLFTTGMVNTPFILQALAWYFAILSILPSPRESVVIGSIAALNNRGIFLARPILTESGLLVLVLLVLISSIGLVWLMQLRHRSDGATLSRYIRTICMALVPFSIAILVLLSDWDRPILRGFGYTGGIVFPPSLCAMVCALVVCNAAYVGEIFRSGLSAIPPGQQEAAYALGLGRGQTFRKVVFPQAFRIVTPPLITQSQDVLKLCSISIVVGFPDLVNLWLYISMNQSGKVTEILGTTMLFYLGGGLLLALAGSRSLKLKAGRN